MKRELYDMDLGKRLAEKLRRMSSEPPKKKIGTKQDIVKMLIGDIEDLLKRDYSMYQIATEISVDGFDIKAPTLKSYLIRLNTEAERKRATSKARERRAKKIAVTSQNGKIKKHGLIANGAIISTMVSDEVASPGVSLAARSSSWTILNIRPDNPNI